MIWALFFPHVCHVSNSPKKIFWLIASALLNLQGQFDLYKHRQQRVSSSVIPSTWNSWIPVLEDQFFFSVDQNSRCFQLTKIKVKHNNAIQIHVICKENGRINILLNYCKFGKSMPMHTGAYAYWIRTNHLSMLCKCDLKGMINCFGFDDTCLCNKRVFLFRKEVVIVETPSGSVPLHLI